jgi:Zn-dependent protease
MDPAELAANALLGYIVFLFSTVCHEAGHAISASWLGDQTAYHNGQVDLNPLPHIRQEPFGLGILPVLSFLRNLGSGDIWTFGFASAPMDPAWAIRNPRKDVLVSLAGPAANFTLCLIAWIVMKAGLSFGWLTPAGNDSHYWELVTASAGSLGEPVGALLSVVFFENFFIGLFNLLPIPPLDGSSLILLILPEEQAEAFFAWRARLGFVLPFALFMLSGFFWEIAYPLYGMAVRALLN